MSKDMELKAYKLLAQIRGSMLERIKYEARNKVEYGNILEPEKFGSLYEHIANPGKWDYCGLLSKDDKAVLEVLEYLLNDSQTEICKYTGWRPTPKN